MLAKRSFLPSWGLLFWGVISLAGCTRFGYSTPHQGDSAAGPDMDVRIADAQGSDATADSSDAIADSSDAIADSGSDVGGPGTLVATPASITDRWVELGTTRHYTVAISTTGTCVPSGFQVSSTAPWITAQILGTFAPEVFRLDIAVDATKRPAGDVSETLAIAVPTGSCRPSPTTIALTLRLLKLQQVHVGPRADTCPHETAPGATTSACDYTGQDGLRQAIAATTGHVHIHLHDDKGATATYSGNVDIQEQTWISAAKTSVLDHVVLRRGNHAPGEVGILRLRGDDCHLSRLTVVTDPGPAWSVTAWSKPTASARTATGHHLIENVHFLALAPERRGSNNIEEPFRLGSDTLVRNCRVEGFHEMNFELDGARRTRLIQNTFVIYQRWSSGIEVRDTQDIVIANNVFIGQTYLLPSLIIADAKTQHLTVLGNVIEGAKALVTGLSPSGNHVVAPNVLGKADLESPLHPRFFPKTPQLASPIVPGEGTSLDGVPMVGGPTWVPGALQKRSTFTARRTIIRVGHGSCGAHICDIDASAKNEIQQAVWSVWRGGTVEVYPSATPYAGSAVIGWPLTLRGMGSAPEDVVLTNADESLVPASYGLWRNEAVITVLITLDARVSVENLTFDSLPGTAQHVTRAIVLESRPPLLLQEDHVLQRLEIRSTSGAAGLSEAILLGDRARVHDTLIHGPYRSCIRFGTRINLQAKYATPISSTRTFNLTCRLTGTGNQAPRAAFEVASVKNTIFANIAVELTSPAPLFRAQRRSTGDTGAKALDRPKSFSLNAASLRGITTTFDGFATSDGSYTLKGLHTVASGDAFFVSATDSHLATGAQAIDTGVDPGALDSTLKAGTSLDGVARQNRQIDRGAYEQGK